MRPGLSPRVRGNLCASSAVKSASGPIPACAGQPTPRRPMAISSRAYPRVCGATIPMKTRRTPTDGLSPRVRGNPVAELHGDARVGPIPACAGQPFLFRSHAASLRAYPRVCGATQTNLLIHVAPLGLSPRVRGNPSVVCCAGAFMGPIPACAGQPKKFVTNSPAKRAYPRVCGATSPS